MAAVKLYNLARMTTPTIGTGTISLDAAVPGFLTFALAGASNGETVRYAVREGANSEIGYGVYSSAGPTLTRNVEKSTNADAAISLAGSAQVIITPSLRDFPFVIDSTTASMATANMAIINANTAAPPTAASALLQLVGIDATTFMYVMDGFGASGQIFFRRTEGTDAVKLATATGNLIGTIAGRGYTTDTGGVYPNTNSARIRFLAGENFTSGGSGTLGGYMDFATVANGTSAVTIRMTIMTGVRIGSTQTDAGLGNLFVEGRITSGVSTLTDGATPALDASLGNTFILVAAGDRTIAVPTNPLSGQRITLRHTASGGARTLALNTGAGGFRFGTTITALTATASGTSDYIDFVYNLTDNFWDVVAYAKGF